MTLLKHLSARQDSKVAVQRYSVDFTVTPKIGKILVKHVEVITVGYRKRVSRKVMRIAQTQPCDRSVTQAMLKNFGIAAFNNGDIPTLMSY